MFKKLDTRIFVICIAVLLVSAIFSVNQETEAFNETDNFSYFPNETMIKVFKDENGNEGFKHIVDRIEDNRVQIKQVDTSNRVAMVYEIADEHIKLIFTEQVGTEGFKEDYIADLRPNRDDIIIKGPIEVGTIWYDDLGGYYEIIERNTMVKTSLGNFESLVVRYANEEFIIKEYYSKGLGLVKIEVNNFPGYQLEGIDTI